VNLSLVTCCFETPFIQILLLTRQVNKRWYTLDTETVDYCQWETFEASCPTSNQVIVVISARYGRMKFGRCMREDHGSVGCAADVTSYVAGQCSGRRRCRLPIPDATLHAVHPCPKELMPYLEASYSCVTGNGSDQPR